MTRFTENRSLAQYKLPRLTGWLHDALTNGHMFTSIDIIAPTNYDDLPSHRVCVVRVDLSARL